MRKIKKYMSVRFVITGKPGREEIGKYSLEAIREGVTNDILTYYNSIFVGLGGMDC
jgi:predicted HTH transcriptional regulator